MYVIKHDEKFIFPVINFWNNTCENYSLGDVWLGIKFKTDLWNTLKLLLALVLDVYDIFVDVWAYHYCNRKYKVRDSKYRQVFICVKKI